MKKIKWLAVPAAAVTLLAGCAAVEGNEAPELRGIIDKSCLVNTAVDLLDGVSALDLEDGDITPALEIKVIPETAVDNGFAVFTQTGEYEVVYSIADSTGKRAQTTCYVTVVDREVYRSDVFTNGFSVKAYGGAEIVAEGLSGSVYSFKAAGGEIAEDIKLTREYALTKGVEYNFKYFFESNCAGKIKLAEDGKEFAEAVIEEGANEITFSRTMAANGADIELWLGGLEGRLEASLSRVEISRRLGDFAETLSSDFTFEGKTETGFSEGYAAQSGTSEDGKSCYIQVTEVSDPARYKANLYINTGIAVQSGYEYEVAFNIESENGVPADICFNKTQYGEKSIGAQYNVSGNTEYSFTADESKTGTLWIQVQAGDGINKITLSGLSVKSREAAFRSYGFAPFTVKDAGKESVIAEYGKISYTARSFGVNDYDNELSSPLFELAGAGANYVISFRAKASKPVNCVFLAHDELATDWITFAWRRIRITEEETEISVQCDDKNLGSAYKFMWQFGNAENSEYNDVTVQITDFRICYKNDLEN